MVLCVVSPAYPELTRGLRRLDAAENQLAKLPSGLLSRATLKGCVGIVPCMNYVLTRVA